MKSHLIFSALLALSFLLPAFYADTSAQVSISNTGTTITPQSILHVHQNAASGQIFQLTNTTSGYASAANGFAIVINPDFHVKFANKYDHQSAAINFTTKSGGSNYSRLFIGNNGNVGIGTLLPGYKLTVEGRVALLETGSSPQYYTVLRSGDLGTNRTFTFPTGYGSSGQYLTTNGSGTMSWTSGESPLTFSNGLTRTTNAVKWGGSLTASTTITQSGTEALNFTNSGSANITFNLTSTGDFDVQDNGTSSLFVNSIGRVGVGTNNPQARFHADYSGSVKTALFTGNGSGLTYVTLKSENTSTGAGIAGYFATQGTDVTLALDQDGTGPLLKGFGPNGGEDEIRITNTGEILLYNNAHNRTILIDPEEGSAPDAGAIKLYDATGNDVVIELDGSLSGDGRIYTQELQITGGSDISELFDIHNNDDIQPGMVLSINPDYPGTLKMSEKVYDRQVAGIVSGANGIQTGLIMSERGSIADGKHLVALAGRVYCLVDASNGTVKPGDLLTTSSTPGYAMKVKNHKKARGAIIGKAMTSLKDGRGLVLVLVSLQ